MNHRNHDPQTAVCRVHTARTHLVDHSPGSHQQYSACMSHQDSRSRANMDRTCLEYHTAPPGCKSCPHHIVSSHSLSDCSRQSKELHRSGRLRMQSTSPSGMARSPCEGYSDQSQHHKLSMSSCRCSPRSATHTECTALQTTKMSCQCMHHRQSGLHLVPCQDCIACMSDASHR